MTTVVYKDGVIASDSAMTIGDIRLGAAHKCGRVVQTDSLGNAVTWLWAAAGDAASAHAFRLWVEGGCKGDHPKFKDTQHTTSRGIVVVKPDTIMVYEESGVFVVESNAYVMGSGRELALGALAAGASVERAVEIACEYDIYSAGPVRSFSSYHD